MKVLVHATAYESFYPWKQTTIIYDNLPLLCYHHSEVLYCPFKIKTKSTFKEVLPILLSGIPIRIHSQCSSLVHFAGDWYILNFFALIPRQGTSDLCYARNNSPK